MTFTRFPNLSCIVLAHILWAAPSLQASSTPAWTFTIPATTLSSDSSGVSSITADVAGNTLIIVQHSSSPGGFPVPSGTQIILVDNRGRLVGAGDFAGIGFPVTNFVSAQKAIVTTGGVIQLLSVGPNKSLVATPATFTGVSEVAVSGPQAQDANRKFYFTATTASSKVADVRCYLQKKLKP